MNGPAGNIHDKDAAPKTRPVNEADGRSAQPDHPEQRSGQSHGGSMDNPPPPPRFRVFFFVVLVLGCLLGYGAFKHLQESNTASETQQEAINFVPDVQTIMAQTDDKPRKLTLPGQTEAFDTATIYPRATGYVAERKVDIGSRVKKGDLLIRIAAPDLDQQLQQAKAQLEQVKAAQAQAQASLDQAKANLALAKVTFSRTNAMTQRGYETVQNNDNQRTQVDSQQAAVETANAGIKVAAANVLAQQATVDRLQTLTQFEQVVSPYDGIITTRGVDVGDLVNADSKTGNPLFTVAKDTVLRVSVNVPQEDAFGIQDGLTATAFLPQRPETTYTGQIARSSIALLNASRVLNTEVDIANPKGEIKPGAFVNVTFAIPRLRPGVMVPAEALIFNSKGMQVAVVDDDQVRLQTISIYRDFGKSVELRDGLNGGEQIVISPPIDLQDRQKVKVKPKPQDKEAQK